MRAPSRTAPCSSQAFSLVEVALALAVVAFAFVSLMGLLPAGLATFRDSVDTSLCAQIMQRVVSDAEQTDFDTFLAAGERQESGQFFSTPIRYFDDSGNELPAAEAARAIYHVRIRGSDPGAADVTKASSTAFTSLPAGPGKTRFNPRDSTFLTVQIAYNPANVAIPVNDRFLWDASATNRRGLSIRQFATVLSRNGYRKAVAQP